MIERDEERQREILRMRSQQDELLQMIQDIHRDNEYAKASARERGRRRMLITLAPLVQTICMKWRSMA